MRSRVEAVEACVLWVIGPGGWDTEGEALATGERPARPALDEGSADVTTTTTTVPYADASPTQLREAILPEERAQSTPASATPSTGSPTP